MPSQLAKTYAPADVEPQIASRWEAAKAFHADPDDPGPPYCIVIPPPNVTAALHMGHALNNTLQDILIRWHRMCGDNTLWMPGTDHAGIATQTVVERRVLAEEGKRRTDFDRVTFVAKIQAWKDDYEAQITNQLKAMGCSCDWQRQRFTMDPICARSVREAFSRLFRDGLIYRGKRLVNWDPATQTALADDEVEMQEIDGQFWYLKYPLTDGGVGGLTSVTVATTRPETMLGDTAVAVHPKDPRAAALRGQFIKLPIVNRIIPIIEDDYVVLPDPNGDEKARYSSGFLKVTPAHDPNDYEIGQRFELDMINVMAPDGTISDQYGWEDVGDASFLLGMDRDQARQAIVTWFREHGLLEQIKPYRHAVGHSYRSHVPIEPYLSDQWYVKVTDSRMAGAALAAMADDQRAESDGPIWADGGSRDQPRGQQPWHGLLKFTPARYARTFQSWHENIRDWCISRQLWWGHRIPVWSRPAEAGHAPTEFAGELAAGALDVQQFGDQWYLCLAPREGDEALARAIEAAGFMQDPDVLDTWFSSALWPFSTLSWPEKTPELAKWNPGDLLCTAREIITLWVSRMVMMNLYLLDQLPFTDVFIHAMLQDGQGRKMSKTLGNGVDPLDIIHSHGSDAMRFTLASMTTNTQDVRMPVLRDAQTGRNTSDKFDNGRNFANKIWNAARFALGKLAASGKPGDGSETTDLAELADRWILSRTARTIMATNTALENYDFSQYAQGLYDFFWRDLCDWYIEAIKPTVDQRPYQRKVLATCLDVALRLLHPVMPFITERLWQRLGEVVPQRGVKGLSMAPNQLLVLTAWPKADASLVADVAEAQFHSLQAWVSALREVRTSHQISPRQPIFFHAQLEADKAAQIQHFHPYLVVFANAIFGPQTADMALVGTAHAEQFVIQVYRSGVEATDVATERERLSKRLQETQKSIKTLSGRLSNRGYTDKAPAHLVEQTRGELAEKQKQALATEQQLTALGE